MTHRLIVGLGNPGKRYEKTRHNIGFLVAQEFVRECKRAFAKKGAAAQWAEIPQAEGIWVVAKPLTFMNRSGEAVGELVRRFGIEWNSHLLVIVDDADLAFGKFRMREKGSSGGHRGLESIIEALGGTTFHRLRIGVGRPERANAPLEEYVLELFSREERDGLTEVLERAVEAVRLWAEEGSRAVMNRYNS